MRDFYSAACSKGRESRAPSQPTALTLHSLCRESLPMRWKGTFATRKLPVNKGNHTDKTAYFELAITLWCKVLLRVLHMQPSSIDPEATQNLGSGRA